MMSDGAPRILNTEQKCNGCLATWVGDWNIDFRYVGMSLWYRLKWHCFIGRPKPAGEVDKVEIY